jgi:Zn-dependent protease
VFQIPPAPTPYDLRFYVAHVPVCVNPWFWLASAISAGIGSFDIKLVLIGIGVVFVSILVHELGHVVAMERFGERGQVLLWMLGGLAMSSGDIWNVGYGRRGGRTPHVQIIISLAGPAAGFLLAMFTVGAIYALGGRVEFYVHHYVVPGWSIIFPADHFLQFQFGEMHPLYFALWFSLYVNIYWGLVNLLPILPLDGGQVARSVFILVDRRDPIARSYWLSAIVAGGLAVLGLQQQDRFQIIFFGSLAAMSLNELYKLGRLGGGGGRW